MSMFEEPPLQVPQFLGRVRLFPLPNLVLFPHIMQPLHVFEPRYRALVRESLRSDRLIAMATLAPGWQSAYEGRPPLYPVACLGQIATYHRLDDGSYNLLLCGVHRVRLLREFPPNHPFREAEAEVCFDQWPAGEAADDAALKAKLHQAFLGIAPMVCEVREQLDQLLSSDLSLGTLTDVISYVLDISLRKKQALLEQLDVVRRAEMVLEQLAHGEQTGAAPPFLETASFPPQFSIN